MFTLKINNLIYIPFSHDGNYDIFNTEGIIKHDGFLNNLADLNDDDFLTSDYGFNEHRLVDMNVRNSLIYNSTINLDMKITNQPSDLKFDNKFEFIKYKTGGFFDIHTDRKRNDNHTHSVLLYPPQNTTGGELVLYLNNVKYVHKLEPEWTGIIFPIEISHQSLVVEFGEKKLIKGIGLSIVNDY